MPYKNRKKEYAKRKRERQLDKLAAFEEFQESFSPAMRRALLDGATPEEILEEAAPLAAARIAQIAMTERDSSKALAAAKDIIDRAKGKAVERKQLEHKFDRMDESAIDALLISKLKEAAINETAVLEGEVSEEQEDSDGEGREQQQDSNSEG